MPFLLIDDTKTIFEFSNNDPFSIFFTSNLTNSNHCSSTRSHLVKTMILLLIPSKFKIWKCSSVGGITDSSAAITIRARSIAPAPASIFAINFLCPGTSIKLTLNPRCNSIQANPKSMLIPRFFSSDNRSVSMPVIAFTKVVFP